jgi:hypothetical protein
MGMMGVYAASACELALNDNFPAGRIMPYWLCQLVVLREQARVKKGS